MHHSLIGAMCKKLCYISCHKRLVFCLSAKMAVLSYFAVSCTSAYSGAQLGQMSVYHQVNSVSTNSGLDS